MSLPGADGEVDHDALLAMQERIAMRKLELELKRQDEELAQLEAFYREEQERERKAEEMRQRIESRKAELAKKKEEEEARKMED